MWYPATITVAAAAEPVTSSEVKAWTEIDFTDDDTVIAMLIAAARAFVEKYCGVRMASQTVSVKCDTFADMARFPEAPVTSITSISYVDTDGATQTLSTDVYELQADGLEPAITLKYGQSWPAIRPDSRITVVAVVGHSVVPPNAKLAILLYIAGGYAHREPEKASEWTAFDSLLCNERRNP